MHDLHNDYPLATEKIKVAKDMLLQYQLEILDEHNLSFNEFKKLILI